MISRDPAVAEQPDPVQVSGDLDPAPDRRGVDGEVV
jgi:hypothetical protein